MRMVDEEHGGGDGDGRRGAVDAVVKRAAGLHRRLHQVEPKEAQEAQEAQEAEEAEEAGSRSRDRRSWRPKSYHSATDACVCARFVEKPYS